MPLSAHLGPLVRTHHDRCRARARDVCDRSSALGVHAPHDCLQAGLLGRDVAKWEGPGGLAGVLSAWGLRGAHPHIVCLYHQNPGGLQQLAPARACRGQQWLAYSHSAGCTGPAAHQWLSAHAGLNSVNVCTISATQALPRMSTTKVVSKRPTWAQVMRQAAAPQATRAAVQLS